jgi:hypothetical protein
MIQVLGLTVLALLFLFTVVVFNSRSNESSLVKGFWSGSSQFCGTANLDLFLIYIGDGGSSRPGFILMKNADGFIINNPVKLHLTGGNSFSPSVCDCRHYSVEIDWLDEEPPEFFPSEQDIHYYPSVGKMVWSKGDTVYAVTYKNNQISDVKNVLPDSVKELDEEEQEEYTGGEKI